MRMTTISLRCGLTNAVGHSLGNGFGHDDLGMMGVGGHEPNHNENMFKVITHVTGLPNEMIVGLGPLARDAAFLSLPGSTSVDGVHHAGDTIAATICDGTGTLRTTLTGRRCLLMDHFCNAAHAVGAPTDTFGAGGLNNVMGPLPQLMA
jgi:hypothetical protein